MFRKTVSRILVILAIGLLTACERQTRPALDQPVKTKLRVALFTLPDSGPMQDVIRMKWLATHPDVELEFVQWESYKVDPPADVDVFEYDAIFLEHLVRQGLAAKLAPDEIKERNDYLQYALEAAKVADNFYGIPRIACTPVIFYRKGDTALEQANSIEDLFGILKDRTNTEEEPKANEGLLIDLSSSTTCACYYLDAVADASRVYTPDPPLPKESALNPTAVKNLQLLTRMAGKKQALGEDPDKRCEWFSDAKGRAFVAWTERLSAIPVAKHEGLAFRPFPLAENNAINLLYVDVLSLNPNLTGSRRILALEFANFVASTDVVAATFLVKNQKTGSPQYLLPVRKSIWDDAQFRMAAPLYDQLSAISTSDPKPFRIGADSRAWFASTRKAIQQVITDVK